MSKFYVGVPDSKLKKYLEDKKYLVATNEGEAIGIATGYFLATGKKATVFMSADGLCNALNPLTSLVIPYQIEMDLIIAARKDEPQHKVMGEKAIEIMKSICGDGVVSFNYIIL
jgi:phosphonopyruvate decarboxylase